MRKVINRNQGFSLLRLAESTALMAGHFLQSKRSKWRDLKSATTRDVKIYADRISEKIIVKQLRSGSNFRILSEESGILDKSIIGNEQSDLFWIIDPLDGSLNYHQGLPLSCVSIALYSGSKAILGVVYDFNHNELFSGLVGVRAWLNHKKIKPSKIKKVSSAILCTGFPVNTNFSRSALSKFIGCVQNYRKIRLLGSAALSLCYVACARSDAYWEENIMFWDIAGGCAIVQSTGGKVQISPGGKTENSVTVMATNGHLNIFSRQKSKLIR